MVLAVSTGVLNALMLLGLCGMAFALPANPCGSDGVSKFTGPYAVERSVDTDRMLCFPPCPSRRIE